MGEYLAYCGLICDTCAIYLATREKDRNKQREMREDIAEQIKKRYGQECKPEDVGDCDGCKANTERLYAGCRSCHIRKCAVEKGIENCAYCGDYPCEALEKFFVTDTGAREQLDAIRKAL